MKHKAKESLDTLECRVYTADEICEINLRLGRCSRCDFKGALKDVQDLINCQLTVEEIDALILTAKVFGTASALAGRPLEECEIFISVQKKLLKQKEMWVSDDETN